MRAVVAFGIIAIAIFADTNDANAHVNLLFPEGGENFAAGENVNAEWQIVIDHGSCNWDLYFSNDGGANWSVISENMPKAQLTFGWEVPNDPTSQGRIKIVQDNDTGTDYESESGDFMIGSATYDILVDVGDFYFDPEVIRVNIGETVRWQNVSGSIIHTSTADGGLWDSGDIAPGGFYDFTFNSEGVYDYICVYHSATMTGTVVAGTPDSVVADIDIISFSFQPQNVDVDPGDYMRWTNFDSAPHTSTSDDGLWDSGTLATGDYYILQADSIGSFGYHCTIHPSMLGTVTVNDTSSIINYEYFPGDANMYNGQWPPQVIGSDVTYLVNYFRGLSSNPPCLIQGFYNSADANGDCQVIGSDVTKLVNYFRGSTTVDYCADFTPAWDSPEQLPSEMPVGWPNCE
jgi:plastocyanin